MPLRQGSALTGRLSVFVGLALYGFVLIGTTFEHHDFACHQKSPTHCSACVASQIASRVETAGAPAGATPPAVGRLDNPAIVALDPLLPARRTGRSPPA